MLRHFNTVSCNTKSPDTHGWPRRIFQKSCDRGENFSSKRQGCLRSSGRPETVWLQDRLFEMPFGRVSGDRPRFRIVNAFLLSVEVALSGEIPVPGIAFTVSVLLACMAGLHLKRVLKQLLSILGFMLLISILLMIAS